MSKRAEDAALEAYPQPKELGRVGVIDWLKEYRRGFIKGYEQAEEDLANAAAFSSGPDGFYYGKGYQQGKKDAEKHLGLHSVEESLPPVDEEVIVLRNESNGITLPYPYNLTYGHLVADKTIFVEYNGWNVPGVKYWMPIPKLPEEK